MKSDVINKIWRYHFTTARGRSNYGGVGDLLSMANSNEKELAGYGIGLPISKAYAEYLGGNLEIKESVREIFIFTYVKTITITIFRTYEIER